VKRTRPGEPANGPSRAPGGRSRRATEPKTGGSRPRDRSARLIHRLRIHAAARPAGWRSDDEDCSFLIPARLAAVTDGGAVVHGEGYWLRAPSPEVLAANAERARRRGLLAYARRIRTGARWLADGATTLGFALLAVRASGDG
jgi:hypothetical protein